MEDGINVFSIKDLENFSGIKAHTIRIWEKRYRILEPDRTDSNIRVYNEGELKKILNVAYLNRNGFKISKIAQLRDDELTRQVVTMSNQEDKLDSSFQPGKILMSAIWFNEAQFKEVLLPFIRRYGIEEAYIRFFHPLLEKSRILWQTGSLSRAQEQFVKNIIHQLVIIEDNKLKNGYGQPKAIVAMINTTENLYEDNFLFYKYILKSRNFDVVFTGGILPSSEVIEIHKIKPFDYLVVNSGAFDYENKNLSYFSNIARSLRLKKVILSDYPAPVYRKNPEQHILVAANPSEFLKIVVSLK
jgi:DNA-binding transcriptional MerR regulator